MTSPVLFDTSVYVGIESGRVLQKDLPVADGAVCVVTIAELTAGVHAAGDALVRGQRLSTLNSATELDPLPIDSAVAQRWAILRVRLAEAGRKVNVNDLWIAAVAAANGLSIVTQDDDFEVIESVGGPPVIKI